MLNTGVEFEHSSPDPLKTADLDIPSSLVESPGASVEFDLFTPIRITL